MSQSKSNIIHKAEKIYFSNNNSELLAYLVPRQEKFQITDEKEDKIFNHLFAFGYVFQNKLQEAERHCQSCVQVESNPLDHYFVLTYLHLSLREYDKVLKFSEQYLALYGKMKDADFNYAYTKTHLCQMHNFIGSAHMELGNQEKAIEQFNQAIKVEKENHLPYLNLVNLYINNKEFDQANKIVHKGMKSCSQVQELRLLEKSLTERPSISACMIVKDEEELLPECLDSIRDWVDEIIIVDTGSSDKTVEIAKSYGAKVYHQAWEGNFSKHRNYSTSLATSDWVFIIDADERMIPEDIPALMQALQNENVNIVSINVFNVYGEKEAASTFLPSVRLWRRTENLQYEGVVHNLLNLGNEHPVVRVNVRMKHLGYDLSKEKMHQKYVRTKKLLEQQLEENPNNAFALYNYAQILKADRTQGDDYPLHNNELIISSAKKAVELTSPNENSDRHIHLMCLDQVAWGYFHNQDYENALQYANQALEYKKNYLDPLLLIGHIYAQQKMWEKAKAGYSTYIEQQAKYAPETEIDSLIFSHIDDRASVYYSLGLIAETEKDLQLAKSYYLKSLDADSGFIETNSRLAQIYSVENDLENAKKYYHQQINLSNKTGDALVGLASIYFLDKNFEKAESYYKEAIALEEFNNNAKVQYVRFLISMQRIDEAQSVQNSLTDTQNNSTEMQTIGDSYFKAEFYNEATECYQKIKSPSAEILNNIGNCYFKLEKFEDAESYYTKSLAFSNAPEVTYRNIGITQIKLNKYQSGITSLKKYIQSSPNDYALKIVLAEAYKKEGEYEPALLLYESLLHIEPNNIALIYALSDCYLLMGHSDSALIGFQRVISLQPDYKPAQEQINRLSSPIMSN